MSTSTLKEAITQAIAREELELGQWEDLMIEDAAEFSRSRIQKLKAELEAL
jgi:hypothetical protein